MSGFVAKSDKTGTVSSATLQITTPSHSTGDTLVAFVGGFDDGVGPIGVSPPSNSDGNDAWMYMNGLSSGAIGGGLHCFIKPASSNEPSSWTWTWASATRLLGTIASYSNPIHSTFHADLFSDGNDADGAHTATITAHTATFTDGIFVYGVLAEAAGNNFAELTMTPDAACTDRGFFLANANVAALSLSDESITGASTEPARSFVDTWTEHGGGHRSVVIRAVILGPSAAAGGGGGDYWG